MTRLLMILAAAGAIGVLGTAAAADPLPSWSKTEAKARIIAFVEGVSDPKSPNYVTPADRIAVFDNDGTLWSEQPLPFQALYAMDVVREKAKADPSILTSDALKAAAQGDLKRMTANADKGLLEILNVSHAGITSEDFIARAGDWVTRSVHPTTRRTYASMTYQPMLELLRYLRDAGFQTYIVSGGGNEFIRSFAQKAYGIRPWQVIGSEGKLRYTVSADGVPTIIKDGGISFIDDKEGKPVGIQRHIGKRPIFAAGNSDGDFAMLEWTTAGKGPRFAMLIHHTDAKREFAYDRKAVSGQLVRGLDEGPGRGWLIVDMAKHWTRVWPDQ